MSFRFSALIGGLSFAALGFRQAVTIIILLVASDFLDPATFGIFTLSLAFVALLQSLAYAGIHDFIIREKGGGDLLDTAFWVMVAISTVGAAILCAVAPALGRTFESDDFAAILTLLVLNQPLAASLAWVQAVMLREERTTPFYVMIIINNAVALVVGVALLFIMGSIYALVIFRWVQVGCGAALFFSYQRRFPRFRFSRPLAKRAMSYSSGLYGSRLLSYLFGYGADIILGVMFTTAEAGLYRLGNRIATGLADIFNAPLRTFAWVSFGAAHRQDRSFGKELEEFIGTASFILLCLCVTLMVFAEPLISALLGEAWMGAVPVVYALAVARFAGVPDLFLEPALGAAGRTGTVLWYRLVSVVLMLAAVSVVSPLGTAAVAWAQTAVMGVMGVVALVLIGRVIQADVAGLAWPIGRAIPFGLGLGGICVVALLGAEMLMDDGLSGLVLALAVAGAAGLALLALAVRMNVFSLAILGDKAALRAK